MYACMCVGHAADLQATGIISVSRLFHDKKNYFRDGWRPKCERFAGRPYTFSQTKNKCDMPSYKRICAQFGVEPNIMQPLCLPLYRSDSIICVCVYFKLTLITLQNSHQHILLKTMSVWPINVVIKFGKKREKKIRENPTEGAECIH